MNALSIVNYQNENVWEEKSKSTLKTASPTFETESYLIGNPSQNENVWKKKCKSTLKTASLTFGTESYLTC